MLLSVASIVAVTSFHNVADGWTVQSPFSEVCLHLEDGFPPTLLGLSTTGHITFALFS